MQLFFQDQPRKERGKGGKRGEGGGHQWTVMESGEEGEDASAAEKLRPLSMVWEH